MLKNDENNGKEGIGLVISTPDLLFWMVVLSGTHITVTP